MSKEWRQILARGWVLSILCVGLLWSQGCGPNGECKSDLDCAGSQRCVANACQQPKSDGSVQPGEKPGEKPGETPSQEPPSSPDGGEDLPPPPDDFVPTEPIPETDDDPSACVDGYTRPCYNGPANTEDVGACKAGTQTCKGGVWDPQCDGEVLPSQEICDGIDNNCDGKVDEDFPEKDGQCQLQDKKGPCAQGTPTCTEGKLTCEASVTPKPEDCSNQIDDDCDGLVDGPPCKCNPGEARECYTGHPPNTANTGECIKGQQTCESNQQWGPCKGEVTPSPELCDGKDNDCDGAVDEAFPEKGQSCSDSSQKGECQRGTYTGCNNGQRVCTSQVKPAKEVCGNGKDDNCDGQVDENCVCPVGTTRSCYTGAPGTDKYSPCKRGTQTCGASGWGECKGEVLPVKEECNGKDDDCNGQVDDNLTRSCKTACGTGSEYCKLGKWGGCSAQQPTSERCDNKDNDCDGTIDEGLKQACSNRCGKGTETCSKGQWVNCSAPKAGTEICDGKDNDCDGQSDEGNPGGGKSCAVPNQKGECGKGIVTCISSRLICRQVNQATTERCDGKDNDCDGLIDESDANLGKSCTISSQKGECRNGKYACTSGRLYCRQTVFPVTEICRDRRDNDCDGKVDEICGSSYNYAVISSSGKFEYARGFKSVSRQATGHYRLTASSSSYGCTKRPLIVAPSTSLLRSTSWYCSGDNFDIKVSGSAPRSSPVTLADIRTNAVFPAAYSGAAYGLWSCRLISITPPRWTCGVTKSYGSPKVTKYSTGIYDISFAGCNSHYQPIFASIYSSAPGGYAVGYYLSSGKCRIRTFDLNGKLADRWFSFWIPNRNNAAWAQVSSSGTLYSSNYFGDAKARWTTKTTSAGRFEIKYPGANSSTAIFTLPRTSAAYHTSAIRITGGASGYSRYISDAAYRSIAFSILFVQ